MTDLSTFLPTLLASAFGGGLVAGGFSIHNRIASNSDEHQKWLRDKKTEAYGAFLTAHDALMVSCSGVRGGQVQTADAILKFGEAQLGTVELLAPPAVLESAETVEGTTAAFYHAILHEASLDEEEDFQAALNLYMAAKRSFIALAQADLRITYEERKVSGSELSVA